MLHNCSTTNPILSTTNYFFSSSSTKQHELCIYVMYYSNDTRFLSKTQLIMINQSNAGRAYRQLCKPNPLHTLDPTHSSSHTICHNHTKHTQTTLTLHKFTIKQCLPPPTPNRSCSISVKSSQLLESSDQMHVLDHNGNPLCMNSSQIGVREECH